MRNRNEMDRSELSLRLRHFGYLSLPWVWLILAGAEWAPGDQHNFLYRLIGLLELVFLIGTSAVSIWHSRDLCVKCMVRIPLDGEKRAESGMWRLKLRHHDWKIISLIAVAATVMGVAMDPTSGVLRTVWSCVNLLFAVLGFNSNWHDRLSFWCPWCRDNGNGDNDGSFDPQDDKNRPIPSV